MRAPEEKAGEGGLSELAGSSCQGELEVGNTGDLRWKGNFLMRSPVVIELRCHGMCNQKARLSQPSSVSQLKEPS